MKLIQKMAKEAAPPIGRPFTFLLAQDLFLQQKGFIEGYEAGFRAARQMAFKIWADEDFKGPSLMNMGEQEID